MCKANAGLCLSGQADERFQFRQLGMQHRVCLACAIASGIAQQGGRPCRVARIALHPPEQNRRRRFLRVLRELMAKIQHLPVPAKMYRHFAVVTVALTVVLALFA